MTFNFISVHQIIAVGTATPRGEDYPGRGNVHLFRIEMQVSEDLLRDKLRVECSD